MIGSMLILAGIRFLRWEMCSKTELSWDVGEQGVGELNGHQEE